MKKLTVKDLTSEEKLRLICSDGLWYTHSLGGKLPQVAVSDGPVGVRKPEYGENFDWKRDIPSIAYPSIQILANTWNRDCAREMGEALANDCIESEVDILLAPGVNIKRNPLNGRNFEYFSEDPYLAGTLAYEYIDGLQSHGVGACLKHYYANNLEYNRFEQSSEVDERTLREIYLKPFELACKAKPVSAMCAYNRINGIYASENKKGFDILRNEFGFDGVIYSDWEAVRNRTAAAKAGLDIEFPFSQKNYEALVADYKAGLLPEEDLDACVERILKLVYDCEELRKSRKKTKSKEERLEIAHKIALEGMVLLKNDGVLPLKKGVTVSVSGEFATPSRCGLVAGGGSAMVQWQGAFYNIPKLLSERLGCDVKYESGFCPKCIASNWQKPHIAIQNAAESDVAIVCAGTDSDIETEGSDRESMRLPSVQENMILETARRNENTVVVLFAGSALDMSAWKDKVAAIIWAGFCGERGGEALADILTGAENPCGKLSESFPIRLEDSTSYGTYNDPCVARYQEGLDVGYRGYDKQGKEVAFPFGFGLSYSTFVYQDLKLSVDENGLKVQFAIKNTSERDGKEISQIYVRPMVSFVYRPEKELKGYTKTFVGAGKTAVSEAILEKDAFAYYSVAQDCWKAEDGIYEILVGSSSREIRLSAKISLKNGKIVIL